MKPTYEKYPDTQYPGFAIRLKSDNDGVHPEIAHRLTEEQADLIVGTLNDSLLDDSDTVEANIIQGYYDHALTALQIIIADRKKRLAVSAGHQLRAGDRVKIIGGRPVYLHGATATVTDVMQTYVRIKLDRDIGKFTDGVDIRCPMSIIQKI